MSFPKYKGSCSANVFSICKLEKTKVVPAFTMNDKRRDSVILQNEMSRTAEIHSLDFSCLLFSLQLTWYPLKAVRVRVIEKRRKYVIVS